MRRGKTRTLGVIADALADDNDIQADTDEVVHR
jgi:hypothetical protein